MKASAEFYNKIAVHHDAIRQICKDELSAMKEPFYKHERVELHSRNHPGDETYFEYKNLCNYIVTSGGSGHKVCAVRYYINEEEWTVVVANDDGAGVWDVLCVEYLNIAELMEVVALLKRELFDC